MATRIKSSELKKHIGYWMRFVSNHVSHAFARKIEARGVTVAEWAVMRQMYELGPANPSRLAEEIGMTRGAISKLIDRLSAKALVERTFSNKDQRFQSVELSPKAQKLIPILGRLADENDEEFFGHVPAAAQLELVNMLTQLVKRHGWKDIPVS